MTSYSNTYIKDLSPSRIADIETIIPSCSLFKFISLSLSSIFNSLVLPTSTFYSLSKMVLLLTAPAHPSDMPSILSHIELPQLPIQPPSPTAITPLTSKSTARYNFEFLHSDEFLAGDASGCREDELDELLLSTPGLASEHNTTAASSVPDLVCASYQSTISTTPTPHGFEDLRNTGYTSYMDDEDGTTHGFYDYDSEFDEDEEDEFEDAHEGSNSFDEFNAKELDKMLFEDRLELLKLKVSDPLLSSPRGLLVSKSLHG